MSPQKTFSIGDLIRFSDEGEPRTGIVIRMLTKYGKCSYEYSMAERVLIFTYQLKRLWYDADELDNLEVYHVLQ